MERKTVSTINITAELEGISSTLSILCTLTNPNEQSTVAPAMIHSTLYGIAQHVSRIMEDIEDAEIE